MGREGGKGVRQEGEETLKEPGQRGFADHAEAEGGEGDPELGGRDIAVERLDRLDG